MSAAFITGVCGGIGGAIAEHLMAEGWKVYGVDIVEAVDIPRGITFARMDVASAESRRKVFERLGGLRDVSALVNVAAVQLPRPFEETDEDVWERTLRTNLIGAAELTRLLLSPLQEHHGAVVNISSVHAHATSPGVVAYATSKAGLAGLTRALAVELAPSGIRVNAVLPGAVDTRMLEEGLYRADNPADARAEMLARTPLGMIAKPSDIAELVAFLVDKRSTFITGQEFVVDGGVLAVLSSEGTLEPHGVFERTVRGATEPAFRHSRHLAQ